MVNHSSDNNGYEKIPFRMHPRVFAALGADLVTNDVVAVIELVKNSYDAFAENVWIRFNNNPNEGGYLEIEDDGTGMTKTIIEDVWCMVATPFREQNPLSKKDEKVRRVAGEKGLGRLSVARLGDSIHMLTKASDSSCWEVTVNWYDIAGSDNISDCSVNLREYPDKSPFKKSGTRIRILGLRGQWDDNKILDLEDNLARLISPFSDLGKFNIHLSTPGVAKPEVVEIKPPRFLSEPKYAIEGKVDDKGNIECIYKFNPIAEGKIRRKTLEYKWKQVYKAIQDRTRYPFSEEKSHCGSFSFEIRAWDIGAEDTQEIAEEFKLQKSTIRKAIRAHKGISVYRDGILALPKSDTARDWLGLDLRRVSRVGTRLSTSQLVGYVSISAEKNPKIKDTSNREGLMSCLEEAEFEELLIAAVSLLGNERDEDRFKPEQERPLEDLFKELSAEDLIAEVIALAKEDAQASEAVPILREFKASFDLARDTIQKRFVYYSRMATVGTIAQLLVHEIRNRTTAFGSFLEFIKNRFGPFKNKDLDREYRCADDAVDALERLADTFAPLASRTFRRRKRQSILEERIRVCLALQRGVIDKSGIRYHVPDSETHVAVDPGELDAILLNLITNSTYWLDQVPKEKREIEFRLATISNKTRVRVWVHDTGPGLHDDVVEKVFWPGVTRKIDGIGMGLTVASELVAEYGGRMSTKHPGTKGGASFAFDLPISK
jgi:signal transduction histidine kinase